MSDTKYKDVVIDGSVFPGKPILRDMPIHLTKEMREEYIPAIEKLPAAKGVKLLCIIMANMEGFRAGTRSYRTHNPGNIGNTDSGANQALQTLEDGIKLQINYFARIINGQSKTYPIGKTIYLPPYYSPEIAKNEKLYGMSPYLPGYRFVFTGQLDQFVKIYSTGARGSNTYLSMIISYFNQNGISLVATTTLEDIAKII